jgi:aminobutyraldehyde dehydrogenase
VDEVSTLLTGEPAAGAGVEIGPVVSQAHFERVTGYLERSRAQGIRAAIGGAAQVRAGAPGDFDGE